MPHVAAQFARRMLLALLAVSLLMSPVYAMVAQDGGPVCLASIVGGDDCCEEQPAAPKSCCEKHAGGCAKEKSGSENDNDPQPASPSSCPCCVHLVASPAGLPVALEAAPLIDAVVDNVQQFPHLCHASSWVFRDFRPPSL